MHIFNILYYNLILYTIQHIILYYKPVSASVIGEQLCRFATLMLEKVSSLLPHAFQLRRHLHGKSLAKAVSPSPPPRTPPPAIHPL